VKSEKKSTVLLTFLLKKCCLYTTTEVRTTSMFLEHFRIVENKILNRKAELKNGKMNKKKINKKCTGAVKYMKRFKIENF